LTYFYENGLRRHVEILLPYGHGNFYLEKAIFENNVNVDKINDLDPEQDFIQFDSQERTLNNITFTDTTQFATDLGQSNGNVSVCATNLDNKVLCRLDGDGDCCQPDALEYCQCTKVGHECLIKTGIKNPSLCAKVYTGDLRYIEENSLKLHGQTTLKKSVRFHGGFTTNFLEVGQSCFMNGVQCNNIASTNHQETFTGQNFFHGSFITYNSLNIENSLTVGKQIDGVSIDNLYEDSVFIDSDFQEIHQFNFENTFQFESFYSNGVSIGVTPAADLTNTSSFVLNEEQDVSIKNLVFEDHVTLTTLNVTTVDNVDLNQFFTNLWTNNLQEINGDIHITNNLIVNEEVTGVSNNATINCIDIVHLNDVAVRLDGVDMIVLQDVVFHNLFSLDDPRGMNVNQSFLGFDLEQDIILRENTEPLTIVGRKVFKKPLNISNNLELTQGTWVDTALSKSILIDQLFSFLDDFNLNEVQFRDNLQVMQEPTVDIVNDNVLADLLNTIWKVSDDVVIEFDATFQDVKSSYLRMNATNAFVNGIDLSHWRENYLSLSHNQNVSTNILFRGGLDINENLSVLTNFVLQHHSTEMSVVTNNHNIKIKELRDTSLFKNGNHSDIETIINFDKLEVQDLNVKDGGTINGVDLSIEALTYGTEEFVFGDVELSGELKVDNLITNKVVFPVDLDYTEVHAGVVLQNQTLTIVPETMYLSAVYRDSVEVDIDGLKTYREPTQIFHLTVQKKLNEIDIGTCQTPNVLLSQPCEGMTPQDISGSLKFGTNLADSILHVDSLKVTTKLINDVNFNDYLNDVVLKSSNDTLEATGIKSFEKGFELQNAAFSKNVFGVKIGTLIDQTLRTADMDYQSGAVTPNLVDSLADVKQGANDLPPELMFIKLIDWPVNGGKAVSLMSENDNNPFKFAGLHVEDGNPSLDFFGLSNDRNTVSRLNPISNVSVELFQHLDFVDIVSIAISDVERILIVSNMDIEDGYPVMSRPNITVSQSLTDMEKVGSLAAVKVEASDEFGIQVTQFSKTAMVFDMAPLKIGQDSCVIVCQGVHGTNVYCYQRYTNTLDFDETRSLVNTTCYQVVTEDSSFANNEQFDNSYAVVVTDPSSESVFIEFSEFSSRVIRTINHPQGTRMSLVQITDGAMTRVFLSFLSIRDGAAYIFMNNQGDEFEIFFTINDINPIDASFQYNDGKLTYFLLDGSKTPNKVRVFNYCGLLKFVESQTEGLHVSNADFIQTIFDYTNKELYLSTTGTATTGIPITTDPVASTSLFKYVYLDEDASEFREEFNSTYVVTTDEINTECIMMMSEFLKNLYQRDDYNYTVKEIGDIFLNMMPRNYIEYSLDNFAPSIESVLLANRDLLSQKSATAVANLYKYQSGVRTIDDNSFLGSLIIYQESSEILYMYARLLSSSEQNSLKSKAISFWSSCKDDAEKIIVGTVENDENISRNHHHEEFSQSSLCSIAYNLTQTFSDTLANLDNRDFAGAAVLHTDSSHLSPRLACGYIKNPAQAKLQFYQDHDEDTIALNPFKILY